MMKCRGMGAAMRKMGGGSMKPVAMKEGKMVERKQIGQGIPRPTPPFMGKSYDDSAPASPPPSKKGDKMADMNRAAARSAASAARSSAGMSSRMAYGKSVKRKMKGKKVK